MDGFGPVSACVYWIGMLASMLVRMTAQIKRAADLIFLYFLLVLRDFILYKDERFFVQGC
jgi:hypothetical protein